MSVGISSSEAPAVIKLKKKRNPQEKYAYIYLAPFLIILATFSFFPIIFTFIISFTRWDGLAPMTFAGLDNYVRLLKPNSRFGLTIFNTFLVLLISLPITVICGLLSSHLLNSMLLRFKKFFQLSFFLPYVVTPVAIGLLWSILFDWQYGTVNSLLKRLELISEPIDWLGSVVFSRIVLALVLVWKNFGYTSVMFLAGISAISYDLYEAASIEGASAMQAFRRITIPLLRPIITFVVVTGVIGGLQLFDEPYLLFEGGFSGGQPYGGPKLACLTMVMNFYDAAFRYFDLGFGAALAYGMFVVIIIFTFIMLKIMLRRDD